MSNIQDRIARARWRKWSKQELLVLASLLRNQPLNQISERLGRSEDAIRSQTRRKFPELLEHHRALFPEDWVKAPKVKPVNTGEPWSDEDRKTIREMYTTGHHVDEIASTLGRSASSIYAQMKLVKLKVRDSGSPRPFDIINMEYENGASIQSLMKKWHIDYYRLIRNLKSHENRRKTQINQEEIELIQERYLSGCSISCIANGLCRDNGTIRRVITEKKLLEHGIDTFGDLIDITLTMVESGFTTRTIAEKLEIPLSRAVKIVDLAKKIGDDNEI